MYHSIKAGKILDMESLDTLSDGTAGGIEQGSVSVLVRMVIKQTIIQLEIEIFSGLAGSKGG